MSRRVPVVHQMNAFECGAACLAMVLGYFGRRTRLDECRLQCSPGRDGVTAQTLISAAGAFGLQARAFALSAANLGSASLPCVVFWNRSHYVVLERWSETGAEIVDPGLGRKRLTREETERAYSGVALLFEPGPDFQTVAGPRQSRAWRYFRSMLASPGAAHLIAPIVGASLLLQAFGFAVPLMTRHLVDQVLPSKAASGPGLILFAALFISAMHAAAVYFRGRLLALLENRLDSHLMLGFFRHLLSLPYTFFQLRSTGDLLLRLSSNTAIREALATYTTSAILDGSLAIVFLAVLLHMSPQTGFAALLIGCMQAGITVITSKHFRRLGDEQVERQSATQTRMAESLMGIANVKASGAETRILQRLSVLLREQLQSTLKRGRFVAGVDAAATALRTFSPLLLLGLGGKLVLEGSMTLGTMLAVNSMAAFFLQPVGSLVMSAQRLQMTRSHLERIGDVMEASPEQCDEITRPAPRLSGRIDLDNVSFRYDGQAVMVLQNISLSIQPGQKIAVVGRSGSGKSTLAKLLLGLYTPTEGEIRYDGIPLQEMDLKSVRRQWGAVLQEPFLLGSSLREALTLQNPDVSESAVIHAAEIAQIHDEISRMPMRYETRIEEGGQSFSGGQRQRLALARALVGEPGLLLLDEATSHLDVVTEAAVDRNLDDLRCTRVVIAHRLSTVMNADLIVALDRGRIVEQGTHAQLLALGGHYAALVRNQ